MGSAPLVTLHNIRESMGGLKCELFEKPYISNLTLALLSPALRIGLHNLNIEKYGCGSDL